MSALTLDLPLSPELVLVSPPEEAALARRLLSEATPPAIVATDRLRATGTLAFWAFCVANCLAPFVLSALAASS